MAKQASAVEPDFPALGLWAGCIALALAALAGALLLQHSYTSLEDDSFMFYRYAYRLASEHRLSWNPSGEPTYGLTALGYLGMVILVYFVHPSDPASVVCVASCLSGILFLILLGLAVTRNCRLGPGTGRACALLLAVTAALSAPNLAHHFYSGMDTTFSMAYLASFILLAAEFERRPSRRLAVLMGALGGLAFTVRPDLLVFSLLIPVCLILFARERCPVGASALVLVVSLLVVGAQAGLASRFLHSPLPLPFYVKSLSHYDPFIYGIYARGPRFELFEFCRLHVPLIAVVIASALPAPRSWWMRSGAVDKGLAAGVLVFVSYYCFFVLQILGSWQRFYYPALPALAYVACRSLAWTLAALPSASEAGGFSAPRRRFVLTFILVCLVPTAWGSWGAYRAARGGDQIGHVDSRTFLERRLPMMWAGLESISALPDDLTLASTEVGLPGAMNPGKVLIDLAGLQTREFAHARFSAAVLFERYSPDLIYMPHPHYRLMIRQIEDHPTFRSRYEIVDLTNKRYLLPVALRKDGRHYAELRRILSEVPPLKPPQPSPP